LTIRPDDSRARLNGSGLVIIRPPWQLDRILSATWTELVRRLGNEGARCDIRWLSRATSNTSSVDPVEARSGGSAWAHGTRPGRSRR
ncbi:MAG: 23S rRNA (adenine(2030)-N(6))-methyltransferase RlmJ, partial [Gammaproteobacteria bacterium]